jgi:hypothetical protein
MTGRLTAKEEGVSLNFKIAGRGFAVAAALAELAGHPSSDPANVHDVPLSAVRTNALYLRFIESDLGIRPHVL